MEQKVIYSRDYSQRRSVMNRRSFLGLTASSLAFPCPQAPGPGKSDRVKGVRLSITWGMLRKMPVADGLALLARLGYDAFERFDWRDSSMLETFAAELTQYEMVCECVV